MKKTILLTLVALAAVCLSSCRGPQGPMGPQGPQGPAGSLNAHTTDLIINANEWSFDNQGQYFYARFDIPQLTSEVYDYGTITCFREYNYGQPSAYQISLPEIKHMLLNLGTESAPDYYSYQQTIDYSFGIGFVEIVLTNSDYVYDEQGGYLVSPGEMHFRLQLAW